MKFSYNWLKEYFDEELPSINEVADVLNMNAFEIDGIEDNILDIDIKPNRAHDSFCHRGIAKEIASLLGKKFRDRNIEQTYKTENESGLQIKMDDKNYLCPRYMGRRIENISVKNSPDWLREKLLGLEERSISNVVDITNFVMLDLGQPMHAFDADKVKGDIHVRKAQKNEKIELLDGNEVVLDGNVLLIADEEGPLAIAGIKGGKRAEVSAETKNIILESANFNATNVRKTSQKLNIKNNSSKRYENGISPELTELAMKFATKLIAENASTENTKIYKTEDVYPRRKNPYKVGISLREVNRLLGTDLKEKEIEEILNKIGWQWEKLVPQERMAKIAGEILDKPYKYGASVSYDAPNYFDCSSFTAYLYSQVGIAIPRITADQFIFGKEIKASDLMPGDLIFSQNSSGKEEKEIKIIATGEIITQKVLHTKTFEFLPGTPVPEGIDHNGIYMANGKIAYASGLWHKGKVVIENLNESPSFKNIKGYRRMADLDEERFVITVPFERLDVRIKEDLVEEIGRIYGYGNIKSIMPKNIPEKPQINDDFVTAQKIRLALVNLGFSEVYTYAFREKGKVEVENPIASNKSFLRNNLKDGLKESLETNMRNAPLLGLDKMKIFEIGTVFSKNGEQMNVAWGTKDKKETKIEEHELKEAAKKIGIEDIKSIKVESNIKFEPISQYPFILRDVAVWTPKGTEEGSVLKIISDNAGELLVQKRLFDKFEKDDRVSYAFSLVFQSQEKTLTDSEINNIMKKITDILNSQDGWQVR
jgi:phenylalanyl-tRNA synthetase beta subunit